MRRRLRSLPVLLALLLFGSGCAAFSADGPGGSGLQVATAFYPLQFVAERVGGDLADVENLTTPGKEPHDLEPTVKETAEIAQSDVVVFERGFQPAVDDAIDQNAEGDVIDVADVITLEDRGHEGHDHGADDAHGEDGGTLDPHFWQDPLLLGQVADAVADALAEADPDHAAQFRANAADLVADLGALDTAYAAGLASCERTTVVVSHDAFGYLSRYGLDFEPIAGLSPDAEPTPADLGRLQALIRSDGVTTIFGERLVSPRLTETLASDMGISAKVLDPIEGLSDETEDQDYLSLMTSNLAELQEANGCR